MVIIRYSKLVIVRDIYNIDEYDEKEIGGRGVGGGREGEGGGGGGGGVSRICSSVQVVKVRKEFSTLIKLTAEIFDSERYVMRNLY
jgi:hypothetical protein